MPLMIGGPAGARDDSDAFDCWRFRPVALSERL
jgi:hypothetical protein